MQPVPGGGLVTKDGGRTGATGSCPAVALDGSLIASNTIVLIRIGTFDATYEWLYYVVTAKVNAAQVLVQITSRTYPGGGSPFATYSCDFATDSTTPSALTYTTGVAGPDFYNLNDVDLPVGLVCWIYQSANGSWYLNDNDTRVDVVQKTGVTPDANGLYDGTLYRYNDGTHALEARGSIKVLDITGP